MEKRGLEIDPEILQMLIKFLQTSNQRHVETMLNSQANINETNALIAALLNFANSSNKSTINGNKQETKASMKDMSVIGELPSTSGITNHTAVIGELPSTSSITNHTAVIGESLSKPGVTKNSDKTRAPNISFPSVILKDMIGPLRNQLKNTKPKSDSLSKMDENLDLDENISSDSDTENWISTRTSFTEIQREKAFSFIQVNRQNATKNQFKSSAHGTVAFALNLSNVNNTNLVWNSSPPLNCVNESMESISKSSPILTEKDASVSDFENNETDQQSIEKGDSANDFENDETDQQSMKKDALASDFDEEKYLGKNDDNYLKRDPGMQ